MEETSVKDKCIIGLFCMLAPFLYNTFGRKVFDFINTGLIVAVD